MIALLALACCAVLYAAGRSRLRAREDDAGPANHDEQGADEQGANEQDPATRFYREQLAGLERDAALGRLEPAEVSAARAELAREYLRQTRETGDGGSPRTAGRTVLVAVPLVALLSFGLYLIIGQSHLPAQPLADRAEAAAQVQQSLEAAIVQVEARLEQSPDDVRGWQVLGPIYLEQQRYGEAANAFRRVLELSPPNADSETDLAEALILGAGGAADAEAVTLLESAIGRDSEHVRSHFYLAGALTRAGDYDEAVPIWSRLLDIGLGNEPWFAAAQSGLATAQAGVAGAALSQPVESGATDAMILGMVEGLAARLYSEGGDGEDWSRLVQARLVLGDDEAAQADFDRGLAALQGGDRNELLAYGESEGLTPQEAQD